MSTLRMPARVAAALLAATTATTLTALVASGVAAASPAPDAPETPAAVSPAAGSPSAVSPTAAATAASEPPARIIGWEIGGTGPADVERTDVVVVLGAHGRPLEVQQWADGAWVVRRTITLADTPTDVVTVELDEHWRQAPATSWRLHVPARGALPAVTSRSERVTVDWPTSTDPDDPTVLVNKDHAVEPEGWQPEDLVEPAMATAGVNVRLRPEAADALAGLAAASRQATGKQLVLVSGFRSFDYQADLFARYAREHGKDRADRFSARAGRSEHQTGWAADVTQRGVPFTEFGGTPSSDWVAENAWRHGFVVRYTAGNEKITGYDPEPWHLRYVGKDLAAYLDATGLTLEEALDHP